MLSMKCFQAAAVALAAVGFGFAPAEASAGSCGKSRSYDRGYHGHTSSHVSAHYRGDGYRVSVSYGSGHYDRGHYNRRSCDRRTVTYHRSHHVERSYHAPTRCETRTVRYVEHRPSGYWTRVYRPPVYETRYYACGTPYRVCVRAGYYEKVWVDTGHHGY